MRKRNFGQKHRLSGFSKILFFPETDERGQTRQNKAVFALANWIALLHDVVCILAVVAIAFVFFMRLITVNGDSMLPTLQDRDCLILLNNLWYSDPEPGDIVVARIPEFSPEPIVKRVIAVEDDVVDIDPDTGIVSVNGKIMEEEYAIAAVSQHWDEEISFPITIEKGCVFLLGDNRSVSYDSRYEPISQVDTRYILGKAIFLLIPGADQKTQERSLDRIGMIG